MPAKIRPAAVLATLVGLAVTVILVLAGGVALSGAEAASKVSCGDTITTDATLHHNLVNCPNNGIIIGADNVTLDLNYHRIDGDETPTADCTAPCDIGVDIDGHGESRWYGPSASSRTVWSPGRPPHPCSAFPHRATASAIVAPTPTGAWFGTA
jgi:hypothetical protein